MATTSTSSLPFVETKLNFLTPVEGKPYFHIDPPSDLSLPTTNVTENWQSVNIINGRPLLENDDSTPKLDREGFVLQQHDTRVENFFDDAEVQERYYAEVIQLVKEATGAIDVQVFDHTIRARKEKGRREPVQRVHTDYTIKSGPQRVKDLTNDPEKLATRLGNRFAFINVWRPIGASPVEEFPLAVSDARTIKQEHFVATDLIYSNRVGEIYYVHHQPEQKFYYFPHMHRGEVLFLKVYDSVDDGETARFVAHTAFSDPTSPAKPLPRESIEVRTIAFFPPSTEQ
jgi:hypothetical protein